MTNRHRLCTVRKALKSCTDEQLVAARRSLLVLARCQNLPSDLFRAFTALADDEIGYRASEILDLERLYFKTY